MSYCIALDPRASQATSQVSTALYHRWTLPIASVYIYAVWNYVVRLWDQRFGVPMTLMPSLNTDPKGPVPKFYRVVCMSDTHSQYNKISSIPEGDILIISGDLTDNGSDKQLEALNEWLDWIDQEHSNGGFSHKILIPGNHDWGFERNFEKARKLVPAADAILNSNFYYGASPLRIYGEPRQPWFYDWAFNVPRDQMKSRVWDKIPTDHPLDILITHGPPFGVRDYSSRGKHVGCEAQREWILKHQPRLVVCGHIHTGYGIGMLGNTLVVNAATCNEYYKPVQPPIVVDI